MVGTEKEGMQWAGNLELDKAVHMLLVDSQLQEELVDQCATSAEQGGQPLVVDQTFHLVCPFQPYVASVTRENVKTRFEIRIISFPFACVRCTSYLHTCTDPGKKKAK